MYVVSADSHVVEPVDLWERAIGKRFGERVPRQVKGRFGGEEGIPRTPIEHRWWAGR